MPREKLGGKIEVACYCANSQAPSIWDRKAPHVLHSTFYSLAKKPYDRRCMMFLLHSLAFVVLVKSVQLTVPQCPQFQTGQDFNYKMVSTLPVEVMYDYQLMVCRFPLTHIHTHREQMLKQSNTSSFISNLARVQCTQRSNDYSISLNQRLLAKDRLKNGTKGRDWGITKISIQQS